MANLENSIKNYEMRQNHSKIALQNLEKSISTYHEKLEILEGVVTGNFYQNFRRLIDPLIFSLANHKLQFINDQFFKVKILNSELNWVRPMKMRVEWQLRFKIRQVSCSSPKSRFIGSENLRSVFIYIS